MLSLTEHYSVDYIVCTIFVNQSTQIMLLALELGYTFVLTLLSDKFFVVIEFTKKFNRRTSFFRMSMKSIRNN